jgi:hypothetical protein
MLQISQFRSILLKFKSTLIWIISGIQFQDSGIKLKIIFEQKQKIRRSYKKVKGRQPKIVT